MNTSGGNLFVGVDDEGTCLGLEQDQFANEDKLLLHWNGLIKTCLGVEFTPYVRSAVRDLGGKRALFVQCLRSSQPVFLRRDNDELFCVRTGNGSQPLKPSEILAYLEQRQADTSGPAVPAASKGRRLGQYTIDRKIGTGAMGVVYRGHHAMLHRPAAIKMLDTTMTDEQTIARFEREVQLTSQLNHPNTIAIYDYGRTAEGVFYYVMEYLDGITLQDLVQQYGPQPEARVIQMLQQICGSLGEAHGVGLIHRDIKPANMMINDRGGLYDFVKLLDFGLVKPLDTGDETALTVAGAVTGTPMYMSPELVERSDEVDARSDLYSLGAVGYFLLAGQPVFEAKSIIEYACSMWNASRLCIGKTWRTDRGGCRAADPQVSEEESRLSARRPRSSCSTNYRRARRPELGSRRTPPAGGVKSFLGSKRVRHAGCLIRRPDKHSR